MKINKSIFHQFSLESLYLFLVKISILKYDRLQCHLVKVEFQMVDEGIRQKVAIYMANGLLLMERWVKLLSFTIWKASISLMSEPSISRWVR